MNELRKFGNGLIVLGVVFLVIAVVLVMYNIDHDGDVGKATGGIVAQLSGEIADRERDMPKTEEEVNALRRAGQDVILIDGVAYIGYLSVPSQSLDLPIICAWSYPNLKIAPCCYTGSVYDDNLVLAGHNYRSHFGRLTNLSVGDTIRFTNVFGMVAEYEVSELQSLQPTAIKAMINSEYDLTLFTCNLAGNARFTVRCTRVS